MSDAQSSQNATASSSSKPKPKQWGGKEAAAARQSKRLAAREEAREAREKADRENAEAERWEEQGKKKRAREDTDSGSDDSVDEYVEEEGKSKSKKTKTRSEKKRKTSSPPPDDDEDELEDPEEAAAAAEDPSFEYDRDRAESAEVMKYFWRYRKAKVYWKPQVVFDYWRQQQKPVKSGKKNEETGEVERKASAHMESAMKIFFSTTGKVFEGRHRCKGCLQLPLRSKRKISDDVPGIILKCKQISPTGRCAQCALVGEKCSLEVQNGDLVRVRASLAEDVPTGLAEQLKDLLQKIQKHVKNDQVRITGTTINGVVEMAGELEIHLEELEEALQGLPVKYADTDFITVFENGEEVDFDR
ncbi:hypothetical protein FFLO_07180 [Filobasidium floriforme]|uniref:Uncharacterized protein n=1 Tax=Filobasidium floriforme TaxID=5210 RepID=A0A8K0JFH9_9TREE|nr:uncharacterized protein HD553DRAFT_326805 [Filobasidium floriforme]XP_046035432.1 uncharacterized protein HD553DRAFT_343405 [Filobasidium floriforme]XP_046036561.1 uncharacterized protein HD553DRAFT_342171 [Filobasidium floriforme]KAG7527192.1 hypothetical protein FFLO_07180 [Filobasidium floriforme]KAH8078622.1 hypothetical protein HD553DRAFT_326805 [Filobasidium floriforme]KAH8082643.1 hypothetical protein HD553DRAFT_343405 [Filobasidium floriforme]KAH8084677.1 hypothetical protein HD553